MQQTDRSPGLVCTFYSYKGGVGRSMALANTAVLLARYGRNVLLIDWDLEAPGLEKYFEKYLVNSRHKQPGLLDLVYGVSQGQPIDWRQCLLTVAVPQAKKISILHAGRDDRNYTDRMRKLDWDQLFLENDLGRYLDGLRDEWTFEFDFVLIDSRTGITDIGGICSILMPDYLICLFTTNEQSLVGVKDVMIRARKAHAQLALDRQRLLVIPIPARDESHTEYRLALDWHARFAKELAEFYADWIPKDETPLRVLDYLKIPYVAFWSFGEGLPVLEEDNDNPKKLAYSYGIVARLIDSKLNWNEVKLGQAATEAEAMQKAEAEKKALEAQRLREEAQRHNVEVEEARYRASLDLIDARRDTLIVRYGRGIRVLKMTLLGLAVLWLYDVIAIVATQFPELINPHIPHSDSWRLWVDMAYSAQLIPMYLSLILGLACAWLGRSLSRKTRALRLIEREDFEFKIGSGAYAGLGYDARLKTFASKLEDIDATFHQGLGQANSPSGTSDRSNASPAPQPLSPDAGMRTGVAFSELRIAETGSKADDLNKPFADWEVQFNINPDVRVLFIDTPLIQAWLQEFMPLFKSWLFEALGREAVVAQLGIPPAMPPELVRQLEHLDQGAIDVAVISRAFVRNAELTKAMKRNFPENAFTIALDRGFDLPEPWRVTPVTDFSYFALVGEGFSKSERYVDFQEAVRDFAGRVADRVSRFNDSKALI